ncbi:hypothetical protein EP837_02711 [Sphingobium sp. EP60837]|nr:hypothetical protein EP837_02711 [Sphingobium sp. EP60837]
MTRKQTLTPFLIDRLATGSLNDTLLPDLSVQMLSSGRKVGKYMRWIPSKRLF